ncbi:MAG TPA: PEP-CTERM sorting domain-containing protein [Bryobacteraceae bacterium]|nr:PEP-CTERM sorting domain-containing protein [Bryobacteraceae bacterium]
MLISRPTTIRRLAQLAGFLSLIAVPCLQADIVSYSATSFTYAASLGSTTFGSCPAGNPVCVEVTVRFLADTANIVPFNVIGASGFENFIGSGSADLFNDQTGDFLSANFDSGAIFVSVDQTNGGIGFGSALGGPTYPLGVYGGHPSIPYATYDLRSNLTLSDGFAWFCPAGTCTLGTPGPGLPTDQGLLSITPTGPVFSSFNATIVEVTSTPEPASILLIVSLLLPLALVARRRRTRRPVTP